MNSSSSSSSSSNNTNHGWPWMKGKIAIADPIPPTSDLDDRPAAKDLIVQHREKIDKIQQALQEDPLYDAAKHDDLWILRFWLSHQKSKAAIDSAKHTLRFRAEHRLDERDVRAVHMGHDWETLNEGARQYQSCCDPATFRFVVHDRCVVSYVQWAGIDQPRLLKEVDAKHWLPGFAFITEYCFQWVDYLTRTTGRLTKAIRIVDLNDITIHKNGQPKSSYRDAKALNAMEDVYPQLLQALYLTEAPFWIEGPWKTIRPLVPKRVLQKFDFLEPSKKPKDLEKLTKFIDLDKLPQRYGGNFPHWPDDTKPPAELLS